MEFSKSIQWMKKPNKACLRDLFDSHCFMGEAEKQIHDFCFTEDQPVSRIFYCVQFYSHFEQMSDFTSCVFIEDKKLAIQSEKKTKVNSQRCMPRTNVLYICHENVTCPETMLKRTSCHFHREPSENRGLKIFIEKL